MIKSPTKKQGLNFPQRRSKKIEFSDLTSKISYAYAKANF